MGNEIHILVRVPDELAYMFDPLSTPVFWASRENGQLIIRPSSAGLYPSEIEVEPSPIASQRVRPNCAMFNCSTCPYFDDSYGRCVYDERL